MKTHFKTTLNFCCFLLLCCIILFSCTKDDSEGSLNYDPISGTWFLIKVNDTDVSDIDCYRDSFIESNGETIAATPPAARASVNHFVTRPNLDEDPYSSFRRAFPLSNQLLI